MVYGKGDECVDGLRRWLKAKVISALMVDGKGNECIDGCGAGNECVDG